MYLENGDVFITVTEVKVVSLERCSAFFTPTLPVNSLSSCFVFLIAKILVNEHFTPSVSWHYICHDDTVIQSAGEKCSCK